MSSNALPENYNNLTRKPSVPRLTAGQKGFHINHIPLPKPIRGFERYPVSQKVKWLAERCSYLVQKIKQGKQPNSGENELLIQLHFFDSEGKYIPAVLEAIKAFGPLSEVRTKATAL